MSRDNFIMIGSGMQNSGKSVQTFQTILNKTYTATAKTKTLILETNPNEYANMKTPSGVQHQIKRIQPSEIAGYGNFSGYDIRRISPLNADGTPMQKEALKALAINVMTNFRNGILLLEDFNKMFRTLPDDIIANMINVRHKGVDVILHIQSVAKLSPTLLENTKIIRYHYQLDSIAKSKSKLEGEEEIFYLSERLVKNKRDNGVIYFYVYIDRVEKKIRGEFSPTEMVKAIQDYLNSSPNEILTITRRRDMQGKLVFNYTQAVNFKTVELFRKYYGNQTAK